MEKRIDIIPYLTFMGNCEEALRTYMEAFGGEIIYMSRWSEDTFKGPLEQVGKVMHAEFRLGGTPMAAGDNFDMTGENSAVRLMVHMDSLEEAQRAISALTTGGGTVLSPLHPHPAPDDGGCGSMVRDPFGYLWIVTCPNPDKRQETAKEG